jgi:hypothetical protein
MPDQNILGLEGRGTEAPAPLSRLDKINSGHVVVTDGGRVAIVPINGDAAPGRPFDGPLVLHVALPEKASPGFNFRDSSPVMMAVTIRFSDLSTLYHANE